MKKYFATLMIFAFYLPAFCQTNENESLRKKFDDSESYFNSDLFARAIPGYQAILDADPDNYNMCFKLGYCYLNSPSEKNKAQAFLEKASKSVSVKYKENSFKEKNYLVELDYGAARMEVFPAICHGELSGNDHWYHSMLKALWRSTRSVDGDEVFDQLLLLHLSDTISPEDISLCSITTICWMCPSLNCPTWRLCSLVQEM